MANLKNENKLNFLKNYICFIFVNIRAMREIYLSFKILTYSYQENFSKFRELFSVFFSGDFLIFREISEIFSRNIPRFFLPILEESNRYFSREKNKKNVNINFFWGNFLLSFRKFQWAEYLIKLRRINSRTFLPGLV